MRKPKPVIAAMEVPAKRQEKTDATDTICSSVMEFRLADFFSEKIIVGPHGVPDPPSLAQMTFTQCTSMSELKIDPGAPPGGQI